MSFNQRSKRIMPAISCLLFFSFLFLPLLSKAEISGCGGSYQLATGYEDNASFQGACGQILTESEFCLGVVTVDAWKFGSPTRDLECVLYSEVNGAELARVVAQAVS